MRLLAILLVSLLQLTAWSQSTIKRVVVDAQRHPLVGVVITCVDKSDKLVRGSITDAAGIFSILADFSSKEWLRISFFGV